MLDDIYSSNSDGIGVMYATTKGLKVVKRLPKSSAEARTMITHLPIDDRELAIHFRYTTHGDTNLDNCHPYDVVPGYVALMHNGILHTGNSADRSKSDTWHFVQDFLQDAVHLSPDIIYTQGFLNLLSEFIEDNRFVFMNGEGRISHVNRDQGIEHDGLWFSNTYAWRPEMLIPSYMSRFKRSSRYAGSTSSTFGVYPRWGQTLDTTDIGDTVDSDDYTTWWREGTEPKPEPKATQPSTMPDAFTERLTLATLDDVLYEGDTDVLAHHLDTYPVSTLTLLFKHYRASLTETGADNDEDTLVPTERMLADALMQSRTDELRTYMRSCATGAERIAEVACYALEWHPLAA